MVPHGHVCQIGISCGFHLSRECFFCQLTQCFLSTDFTGAGFLYLLYYCSLKFVTLLFFLPCCFCTFVRIALLERSASQQWHRGVGGSQ